MNVKVIGIAGGTASGKTTVARRLKDLTESYGSVIAMRLDDYYKDSRHLSFEERRKINFDHPDAYDFDLFISDIKKLMNGESINKPIYDFVRSVRSEQTELVNPASIIIVEGIMAFTNEELLELFDMKVYVDTPDDIRFIRRLRRDIEDRGRTIDSVINQYLTMVRPMHLTFVEPSKEKANLVPVFSPSTNTLEIKIPLYTVTTSVPMSTDVNLQ